MWEKEKTKLLIHELCIRNFHSTLCLLNSRDTNCLSSSSPLHRNKRRAYTYYNYSARIEYVATVCCVQSIDTVVSLPPMAWIKYTFKAIQTRTRTQHTHNTMHIYAKRPNPFNNFVHRTAHIRFSFSSCSDFHQRTRTSCAWCIFHKTSFIYFTSQHSLANSFVAFCCEEALALVKINKSIHRMNERKNIRLITRFKEWSKTKIELQIYLWSQVFVLSVT